MKKVRVIISFIMIMTFTLLLVGCNDNEKNTANNTSGFEVYYIGKDGMTLKSEDYEPKGESSTEKIADFLKKLQSEGNSNQNESAIPKGVNVNKFDFIDDIVTVDFDESYMEMDSQREVLCRAAVVMTISQIEGVEYVSFTINDYPYRKEDGPFIGAMKPSDFVSNLDEENKFTKAEFKIYFANADGSKLKEYVLSDAEYGQKSKERFVVEQLIKGPSKKGYTATLSKKVELLSVVTANNICYVDFGESFLTEQSNVSNTLVIYSIVDSLMELNNIHKVQISVNGNSLLEYHDDISLEEPFIRNLDLLE